MREILFRGKTTNGEWVYGNLAVINKDFSTVKKGHYISNSAGSPFAYLVRPETVGQFTGLLDKNGNKIFEGDVCQIMRMRKYGHQTDNDPLIVGHVEFGRISVNDNDLSVFNAFHINERSISYLIGQELEVIGNIHQSLTRKK
ncbi:YopX family protein [Elizabethkingia meningoseptica]|uniref:YopX family protein n=1 Tax=Elizabethkingia meningoseptica TaxID=238 RepID=UPI00389211AA